jgi:hypothetical protein
LEKRSEEIQQETNRQSLTDAMVELRATTPAGWIGCGGWRCTIFFQGRSLCADQIEMNTSFLHELLNGISTNITQILAC